MAAHIDAHDPYLYVYEIRFTHLQWAEIADWLTVKGVPIPNTITEKWCVGSVSSEEARGIAAEIFQFANIPRNVMRFACFAAQSGGFTLSI